jgi:alcohol dehydrogenase (cytochrome c)
LPSRPTAAGILTAAALTLGGFAAFAQDRGRASRDVDLIEAPTAGWPTNGGDWYNRRYSPLVAINRDNVAALKGVWRTHLASSGVGAQYSGQAQPIVDDGIVYMSTGANDVFALDVGSGDIVWDYRANLDPMITTVCCSWVNRGVAIGDGKVYAGQLDGKLVALDQEAGTVVWSIQAERWEDGITLTSAPLYYDGLVITGFAGAELGVRGRVKAYDADDGSLVWTFFTIPGPGEFGHDTWPQDNDLWQHGGATVWQTPAVDPELGLLYFSTGNPGPDFNGGVRAGDNLFSASILAVDAKTGVYRWHFQQVHHDLWDYDSANPVVLFDIELDGVERKALAQASKSGWVYILDRKNGKPLIGIEERPVPQEPRQATSPTQPIPIGEAFVPQSLDITPEGFEPVNGGRIFTPFWTDYVIMKPGINGGANWPPASFDPTSGLLYVCASDNASVFRAWEIGEEKPPAGELYIGGNFGSNPMPRFGVFAAMDMRTNTIVWRRHWAQACYSGSVTTAGGLVFVGRNDGRLTALDSSNGAQLWEFQTGAGLNAPASVFEHDGKQYVVAFSAGSASAGSARGDSVWLFSLDGDIGPVEPAGTTSSLAPSVGGAADLANGSEVFETACTFCHGADGAGGHGGPAFTALSVEEVRRVVGEGRNEMPAFGTMLSPEQIRDVSAHVARMLAR